MPQTAHAASPQRPCTAVIIADGAFAYVTNANSVSVIDTAKRAVVRTIGDVASGPCGVDITTDGAFVYISNPGPRTVTAIDTAKNVVVARVPVGINPLGVGITPM